MNDESTDSIDRGPIEVAAMAHTPGPWRVDIDPRPGMEWNREVVADGLTICFMAHSNLRAPERDEANACLVAAAPDLLAACRLALDAFERNDCIDWNTLRVAIDKAAPSAA